MTAIISWFKGFEYPQGGGSFCKEMLLLMMMINFLSIHCSFIYSCADSH